MTELLLDNPDFISQDLEKFSSEILKKHPDISGETKEFSATAYIAGAMAMISLIKAVKNNGQVFIDNQPRQLSVDKLLGFLDDNIKDLLTNDEDPK